jgi:hypothetical protein
MRRLERAAQKRQARKRRMGKPAPSSTLAMGIREVQGAMKRPSPNSGERQESAAPGDRSEADDRSSAEGQTPIAVLQDANEAAEEPQPQARPEPSAEDVMDRDDPPSPAPAEEAAIPRQRPVRRSGQVAQRPPAARDAAQENGRHDGRHDGEDDEDDDQAVDEDSPQRRVFDRARRKRQARRSRMGLPQDEDSGEAEPQGRERDGGGRDVRNDAQQIVDALREINQQVGEMLKAVQEGGEHLKELAEKIDAVGGARE